MIVFLFLTVGLAMFVGGIIVTVLATKRNSDNKVLFFENAKDRDGTIFMFLCFIAVLLLVYLFQELIDDATLSFILGNLVNGFILVGKSAIDSKLTNGNTEN